MKTSGRMLTTAFSSRYTMAAFAALFISSLFANVADAQERRGGERNGGGGTRQSTWRDAPAPGRGENIRRSEVAVERNNAPRDFNRVQSPAVRNNAPSINRDFNRGNNPANADRNFNRGNGNFNRNNNTGAVNRDFSRNENFGRNNNSNYNRPGNNYNIDRRGNFNRPVVGTLNRPGYRPVYGYDRRPAYNAFNPSWRYGYLPRRNSYFYSLPSTYFNINFGGFGYRYWDGVFYRPYNNLFTVCAPPIGIFINTLPIGYSSIYVNDYPYYYYNGTYYDQRGSKYTVVSPPVGAVVESLPDGYETVVIDGETYYTVDGAQYKPVVQQNGEIWYEVVKAN